MGDTADELDEEGTDMNAGVSPDRDTKLLPFTDISRAAQVNRLEISATTDNSGLRCRFLARRSLSLPRCIAFREGR